MWVLETASKETFDEKKEKTMPKQFQTRILVVQKLQLKQGAEI